MQVHEGETSEDDEHSNSEEETFGFDFGHEPSKILGANEINGRLLFLVTWKDKNGMQLNRASILPSEVANAKMPQMVIKFYETHINWANIHAD